MGSDLEPVIEALRRAIQEDPPNGPVQYALAALLALAGDLDGASRHLKVAESLGVHAQVLRDWIIRKYGRSV